MTSPKSPVKMSNTSFRLMTLFMYIEDLLLPRIDRRVQTFGIKPGMTVVDYGCGPGRYATRYSKLVGSEGRVYAVDIQELALETVRRKTRKLGLKNVEPALAVGYNSAIPNQIADIVTAIDMFGMIPDSDALLTELHRIIKKSGVLIIDDGHLPRSETIRRLLASHKWTILQETPDHLTCKPT